MTLNQMAYFKTLAQVGHMGQAAEQLYISQPSLSVSISKLEEELGLSLFDRKGHRLALTDAGCAFLTHVDRILQETEEARVHMRHLANNQDSKIYLGCITSLLQDYFPRNMKAFLQLPENKAVRFEFSLENTSELVRRLKNGVYDLLLCSESGEQGIEQVPILSEPIMVISPPAECRFSGTWEQLAALPLIGYEQDSVVDRLLQKIANEHGFRFHFRYRAPTENAIASLVEHGLGWAVLPWSPVLMKNSPLPCSPLPTPGYTRKMYLTTLAGRESCGAARRFIQFLSAQNKTGGAESP